MIFGACVLLINGEGKILAVSRKDDKEDFGLPGGKVEPGETPIEAALRELFEETGFQTASSPHHNMIYHAEDNGKLTVTYQVAGEFKQVKTPTEAGAVSWVTPDTLAAGKTFGEYNRNLFKAIGLRLQSEKYSDYNTYSTVKKKG